MLEMAEPKVERVVTGHNYGRFSVEPLEPGYGITMGNALRRILLRSLPGAAIVRARIADVWHEFSTIEGVREDVTEIVLNLKRVRVRPIGSLHETRAHLYFQGSGVVTAGDIDWPSDIEIVNPEQVIATIDAPTAAIEMDLVVASGRGYRPAEAQTNTFSIGEIPIDAIFTPIQKVNYVVEHTRMGPLTDYDRLIIEIQTDGTIEPSEALSNAAEILVEHGQKIAHFNREPIGLEADGVAKAGPEDLRPLAELGLSPRVLNALRSRQIERVGQVMNMERDQLLSIRNFGPRSLRELLDALVAHNYAIPATLSGGGAEYAAGDGDDDAVPDDAEGEIEEESES